MNNKSFALLVVAILALAGAGGMITAKTQSDSDYEEVEQFLELSKVPRQSGFDEKIGDYIVEFAKEHNLPYERDSVGNVLIEHPGYCSHVVILQCHMDMVPKVDEGFIHNFTTDPILPIIKDGIITAQHTTLGADDGTGMAICLCALKSSELDGIGFKCLFTVDEETDMKGGKAVTADWIGDCDYLVNVDNETEGEILFGCAGAYFMRITDVYDEVAAGQNQYLVRISGLAGGHSGVCIDLNRANAILLAMELMGACTDAQIISVFADEAVNAIPDKCTLKFSCAEGYDKVKSICESKVSEWNSKYSDKTIAVSVDRTSGYDTAMSKEKSRELIQKVLSCPNGESYRWEGYLISSSNMGKADISNGKMRIEVMSRSAIQDWLTYYYEAFVQRFGEEHVEIFNENIAWLGDADDLLSSIAADAYKGVSGKDVTFNITHGGLEAGIFSKVNPYMQIISLGPTITGAHTTSESVSIDSFHTTKLTVFEIVKKAAL